MRHRSSTVNPNILHILIILKEADQEKNYHDTMKLLFAFGLLLTTVASWSQPQPAPLAIKSTPDFEVQADTGSANWKNASWVNLPARGGEKKYNTRFKMLYSATGVYCLYYCEDEKIVSAMTEDFSDLWKEDVVEAFFWTDETVPLYFEYELSPKNVELPILVPNDKGTYLGWRPWHYEGDRKTRHAASVKSTYWVAEFFIPYSLLKPLAQVPPIKGTKWRCNFYRLDHDQGVSRWAWQPVKISFHDYPLFGTVVFE